MQKDVRRRMGWWCALSVGLAATSPTGGRQGVIVLRRGEFLPLAAFRPRYRKMGDISDRRDAGPYKGYWSPYGCR